MGAIVKLVPRKLRKEGESQVKNHHLVAFDEINNFDGILCVFGAFVNQNEGK